MDEPPRTRPPLAKVGDSRHAFGALVRAATRDADAARGLVAAYTSLSGSERLRLIDAVVADARVEGVSPAPVLSSLLPAECDPPLAARIAAALVASDTRGLCARAGARALLAGDATRGGALFVLPLYAEFVEVFTLCWNADGICDAHAVPLVRADAADGEAFRLPADLALNATPFEDALDLARTALWRHRRMHGRLPAELDRFADVLAG
jgi:hypothetical protein